MKKTFVRNALLCISYCLISVLSIAQYAPDQSYNGAISFGITSNNFVALNVRYVLTGPSVYRNEFRTDGPLTEQADDGALRFDVTGLGELSSVRIEMGNATTFKLAALSFYGKADGNISIIPNGNIANAVIFNSSGSFITQLNYNLASNPNFSNLSFFTISGANLSLDIDDVNFEPPQIILPVNIISFEATRAEKRNKIFWSTASESNSSRFEIERSADGINYFKILEVVGSGTTQSVSRYTIYDESPLSGNNFYKLVQYDIDGKSIIHGIKMVIVISPAQNATVSSYPNPVEDILTVTNYRASTTFTIFNQAGAIVMGGPLSAGITQVNVSTLVKGVYVFVLEDKSILRFVKR